MSRSSEFMRGWILCTLVLAAAAGPPAAAQGALFPPVVSPIPSFGYALATAGDADGDGRADVLVGAPGSGATPSHVEVRAGATGALLAAIQAPAGTGSFGSALAALGDFDLDGTPDFAVGAPGGAGAVYVHSGATFLPLLIAGPGPFGNAGFGTAVALLGDLDADGIPEWGAGAPDFGAGAGGALVLRGADGAILFQHAGGGALGELGFALARAGDVDGDSVPDYAIGAPGQGQGAVLVASGTDGSAIHVVFGVPPELGHPVRAFFGQSLGFAGDQDGDAVDDLLVGSVLDGGTEAFVAGGVVVSGASGAFLAPLAATGPADGFASSHDSADVTDTPGDLDGDGIPELIVGSAHLFARQPASLPNPSGARLYPGGGGAASGSQLPAPGEGAGLALAGDANGDGFIDLALGGASAVGGSFQVFSLACAPVLPDVQGCAPAGQQVPKLRLTGCVAPGCAAVLRVTAPSAGGGLLFIGPAAPPLPLGGGCALGVAPVAAAVFLPVAPPAFTFEAEFELPLAGALPTFALQFAVAPPAAAGLAISASWVVGR